MYKVSIVVPVYNGEKYLEEALNSIQKQTIGFNNLEVIVVSDGSTDGTDKIAEKFVEGRKNCKFLRNQIPSGVAGKPRNLGLKEVTGECLMFLDADDFFEVDAVEKMYECIMNTNYNFVTTNYKLVDKNGHFMNEYGFKNDLTTKRITFEDLLTNKMQCNGAVWNKIFKTQFVKDIKASFLEGDSAEDLYFTMSCFLECENALFVPEIVSVNYRQLNTSMSNNITYKYFIRINNGYMKILNKFKEYGREEYAKMTLAEAKCFFINLLINSEKISDKQFVDTLKEMDWYFNFVKDVEFGNETPKSENLIELIVSKKYDTLLSMRRKQSNEKNMSKQLEDFTL